MKQKDILLIAIIIIVSGVASLFISKSIFKSSSSNQQEVASVQSISNDFPLPSSQYFNSSSFDPTQIITINNNSNQNPFGASQ